MPRLVPAALLGLAFFLVLPSALAGKRPSDEARGKELYERHCQSCHGLAGRGDGPATRALVQPVPDLKGKLSLDQVNERVELVLVGRGAMPGFEMSFDSYDARRVLRHLARVLENPPEPPPPPGPPKPGAQ